MNIPLPHPLSDPARFRAAIERFDAENAQDPNTELDQDVPRPRELVYAERLTAWILRLCPNPSEALLLAGRSQHIGRWSIPRNSYPMDRAGYLRWRSDLKQFHAKKAGQILHDLGYPNDIISRVQSLNLKKNFPADPDTRTLEDALCLLFLEFQLADLAQKTDESKVVNALKKSWAKMTPPARQIARQLPFGPKEKALLQKALAGPD